MKNTSSSWTPSLRQHISMGKPTQQTPWCRREESQQNFIIPNVFFSQSSAHWTHVTSMETLKARLDGALSDLVLWEMSLPIAGELELGDVKSPLQPKLFCDSMILNTALQIPWQHRGMSSWKTNLTAIVMHTCRLSHSVLVSRLNNL